MNKFDLEIMIFISEYDERQLNLMLNQLIAFENKKLDLSSLVGRLEGLLHAMENVTDEWEEKFLKEVTILETANALAIIKDSGEDVPEIETDKKKMLINKSIINLKNLVENKLIQ